MQRKNWLPQSTDLCLNPVTQLQPNLSRALQVNTLSSIAQAVEICILNSIDAGGREIHVQLDAGSHSFVVTDDGCGLRQEDLALLSSWDLPSKSSKNLDQKRSGLGFAALCSTAVVEVCSRASGKFETFSCLLRGGQVLQLKLAAEQRSRSGTVITVKDLFFNRPVIRKALDAAGR